LWIVDGGLWMSPNRKRPRGSNGRTLMHLTRHRWDLYCLAATVLLAIASLLVPSSPRSAGTPTWGLVLWSFRFWIAPAGEYRPAIKELPAGHRRLIAWTVIALALFMAWLVLLMQVRLPVWITPLFSISLGSVSFVLATRADLRHPPIPNRQSQIALLDTPSHSL